MAAKLLNLFLREKCASGALVVAQFIARFWNNTKTGETTVIRRG
jgi:hypothetical protein